MAEERSSAFDSALAHEDSTMLHFLEDASLQAAERDAYLVPLQDAELEFDLALLNVTCRFEGAEWRWNALCERGADDEEIERQLTYEFGIEGGGSMPGTAFTWWWAKGRPKPMVYVGRDVRPPKNGLVLKGQRLIQEVRRVWGIPRPAEVGQLELAL